MKNLTLKPNDHIPTMRRLADFFDAENTNVVDTMLVMAMLLEHIAARCEIDDSDMLNTFCQIYIQLGESRNDA